MALYIAIATSRRSAGCIVCKELKSLRVLYKFVHVMLRMRILDPERRRIALVFIIGGARCAPRAAPAPLLRMRMPDAAMST